MVLPVNQPLCQQDVDEGRCIKFPKLYILGQQNVLFNATIFGRSLFKGILHAIIIFFVLMGCYYQNFYPGDGYEVDFQSFGYIASGALTFIVTLQVNAGAFVYYCVYVYVFGVVYVCLCILNIVGSNQICQHWFFIHTDRP